MKRVQILGLTLSSLIVAMTTVYAQGEPKIRFGGAFIQGPFQGQTIKGSCNVDPRGDLYRQTTHCEVKIKGNESDLRVQDAQASLEVVGGGRLLRIILGATMGSLRQPGNFKTSAIQATTSYDHAITLFDSLSDFVAVVVDIGGISTAGTTPGDGSGILWDIQGSTVYPKP